jgi:hypothetical protein
MGETPAEARRRMGSSDGAVVETEPPLGEEVEGPLSPEHMAAIRAADEGFSGGAGETVEDAVETTEPPTPSKAMEVIRQLGQDKIQLRSELDAALNLVERYKSVYGELD